MFGDKIGVESSSINRSHDTCRDLDLCRMVHIYGQKLIMDTISHKICLGNVTVEWLSRIPNQLTRVINIVDANAAMTGLDTAVAPRTPNWAPCRSSVE